MAEANKGSDKPKDTKKKKSDTSADKTIVQKSSNTIGNVTELIKALETALGAANDLYVKCKPILESEEAQELANKTKDAVLNGMKGATEMLDAHAEAKCARKAAKEQRQAAKSEKLAAKELEMLRREAKQSLLSHASSSMTYKAFVKQRNESAAVAEALGTGLFNVPACFVIATYPKFDFDNDLTDYVGVYVGSGLNAGEAIEQACSRAGNVDVYADVKFNQNVTVYLYSCTAEDLDRKQEAIIALLEAEESYNAPIDSVD